MVGGSAGSLPPLRELTAVLPPGLPGSVLVTMHVGERARSRLPWLLSRSGPLPAAHAKAGERVRPGRVYVAPPGCHLLVPGGVAELSNGPRVNRSRPGAIAVPGGQLGKVITGMLGESGLMTWPRPERREVAAEVHMEDGSDLQFLSHGETRLTRLACPECGGALAETVLPRITYYRCHVGHQFGPQSLAAAQAEAAEAKLWSAVAALEETAALARHLASHTELGEDAAGQQKRTADRAARLAESVRAQVQDGRPFDDGV